MQARIRRPAGRTLGTPPRRPASRLAGGRGSATFPWRQARRADGARGRHGGNGAIPATHHNRFTWIETGDAYYTALISAIDAARQSVRLESYIYTAEGPGLDIRAALIRAARRGVQVKVLMDAFGSLELPGDYWDGLRAAGGAFRAFNPLELRRIAFRDHRKLVVCDGRVAFVGGFNISSQEVGDGLTRGWRDLAVRLEGALVKPLADSFDEMFQWALVRRPRMLRLRRFRLPGLSHRRVPPPQILTSSPSGRNSPLRSALVHDLKGARSVRIISAYFLPSGGLRRALVGIARRGGDVQMVLAGQSDVPLSRLAGRALYQRYLHAGIRIFEYQPQVLHTKLFAIGSVVYIGSANLDARSLGINYELVVRLDQPQAVLDAERIFQSHLPACHEIRPEQWRSSRGLWEKLKERVAHLVLAYIDPYLARRQLARLR